MKSRRQQVSISKKRESEMNLKMFSTRYKIDPETRATCSQLNQTRGTSGGWRGVGTTERGTAGGGATIVVNNGAPTPSGGLALSF